MMAMVSQHGFLVVDSEQQRGARASLVDMLHVRVGSGYDNDVVLRTDSPGQLLLHQRRDGWNLESVSGDIRVANKSLPSGQQQRLTPNTSVSLGSASFHIELSAAASVSPPICAAQSINTKPSKLSFATLALLTGITALGYLGVHDYWQLRASDASQPWSISNFLAADGLENVRAIGQIMDPEGVTLHGRLASRDILTQLQHTLRSANVNAQLKIQVDADLQNSVQDVFRTHSVDAIVEVDGQGSVKVSTNTGDTQLLDDIKAVLEKDVPSLIALQVNNKLPLVEVIGKTARSVDPEKEVISVVAGPGAYVVTQDQARYFVGAVLPSGHTITEIKDSTVYMVKAGEQTQLTF